MISIKQRSDINTAFVNEMSSENDLRTCVEHTTDIGSDTVLDIVKSSVVPMSMTGVPPERLLSRLRLRNELTQSQNGAT